MSVGNLILEIDELYEQIVSELYEYTGVNFNLYKEATLKRRIQRRMGILQIEDVHKYVEYLIENDEEKECLYKDIKIGVTEFFRDNHNFKVLYDSVLTPLVKGDRDHIRIWSIACSTGEEAYSLAILINECMEQFDKKIHVEIFATDLNKKAINIAQSGVYSEEAIQTVPVKLQEKYFVKKGKEYKIIDSIRRMIVFAHHDILKDAPFMHMDIVVCRNLFIYLKAKIQCQILMNIYKILNPEGVLFLGSSEQLGSMGYAFDVIDQKTCIFSKNINAEQQVYQTMKNDSLTIDNVDYSNKMKHYENGMQHEVQIVEKVIDLLKKETRRNPSNGNIVTSDEKSSQEENTEYLVNSLKETSVLIQSFIEELGIKNEELEWSHENKVRSNEKLQSINEELQSVNEELYSVNNDYQEKISELTKANADFDNLLMNAEVGALFLDNEFYIRKITPIMSQNSNLLPSDIGRPIYHVRFMDEYKELEKDVEICRRDRTCIEREIVKDGIIWMFRLCPYVTQNDVFDGVLIIMFDVTKRLEAAKQELQVLNNSIPGAVVKFYYDDGLIVEYCNDALYHLMHTTKEQFYNERNNHYEKNIYKEDWERVKAVIEERIQDKQLLQVEYRTTVKTVREWRLMQGYVVDNVGEKPYLQCVITDITPIKDTQTLLNSLLDNIDAGIMRAKFDGQKLEIEYISKILEDITGYEKKDFVNIINHYNDIELSSQPLEVQGVRKICEILYEGNDNHKSEYLFTKKDKTIIWIDVQTEVVHRYASNIVIQFVIHDIDTFKNNMMELEDQRQKLSAVLELSNDAMFEYNINEDSIQYYKVEGNRINYYDVLENVSNAAQETFYENKDDGVGLYNLLLSGQKEFSIETKHLSNNNTYRWVEIVGKTIYDVDGTPRTVLGKIRDIDEQKTREIKLKDKSERDSLTGLYNHETIRHKIIEKLEEWEEGNNAFLIVCDIDDFKRINDLNGHLFGDAVICSFADELQNLLPKAYFGRIGGDEFIVYIPDIDRDILVEKLTLLNEYMSNVYKLDMAETNVSCSLGVVFVDQKDRGYDTLFKWADSALYEAKNKGKSTFVIKEIDDNINAPREYYLTGTQITDDYVREEALVRNKEDLLTLCMELLENVPSVMIALKMICDRTCRFFSLDDVVYLDNESGKSEILYQWRREEDRSNTKRLMDQESFGWNEILQVTDKHGVLAFMEEQPYERSIEAIYSVLLVASKEVKEYQGSILFAGRKDDCNWDEEKDTLVKISNLIFNHFRQLKIKEKHQNEMDRKLNFDLLTGLPQYHSLIQKMEKYISDNGYINLYCVYFDFSNFQYLNEVYGYGEGDKVLQTLADTIKENNEYGIVFSRINSDHFVGFMRFDNDKFAKQYIRGFAERFCDTVNEKYKQCNIVIAGGIYHVTGEEPAVSTMVDCANEARKKVKEQKVVTSIIEYNDEIRIQIESYKEILANMVTAYNNDEFVAYFQPKISLETNKIVGAEALVRWIRPDGTRYMPDQFIDIFESNGFITKIDFCVLDQVLAYLREGMESGEMVVPISVNFSRRHNEFDDFIPNIISRLEENHMPSDMIEVEITESVFLSDLTKLDENTAKLRENNIPISIDDFGSGYSSLNILSRVNADIIKMDRQFLLDTSPNSNSPTVIKHIISMLKHLGFKVIAEGVETVEQVEMLRNANCDMAQGYYYAKPMPIDEFKVFLQNFNE